MRPSSSRFIVTTSFFLVFVFSCAISSNRIVYRPASIPGADPVGTETCLFCHDDMEREFHYTAHARLYVPIDDYNEVLGCEACHGEGSIHMEVGGNGEYIINPARNPEVCLGCHLDTKIAFNLQYHHPVEQGRMNCISCHDPHGENIFQTKGMKVSRENDLCGQCHTEQTRPRVFEHEALREGCTVCHRSHGSINPKMLTENDNNLCLKCHAQIAAPGTNFIGLVPHTARIAQGTCWSAGCHTAVHGSDINSSLRY